MRRPGFLADANIFNLPGLINAPVAANIFLQREREKKRREMRDLYKKQRPPPLQPVLPPAPGIPTEHLIIGGLLAILLLRKEGLPIDNLLLPLAGVGAFLWYKNKTKLGPRASYPLHIGPGHPRAIMSSMIKNKKQKRDEFIAMAKADYARTNKCPPGQWRTHTGKDWTCMEPNFPLRGACGSARYDSTNEIQLGGVCWLKGSGSVQQNYCRPECLNLNIPDKCPPGHAISQGSSDDGKGKITRRYFCQSSAPS